jgi:hypothetical protein
VRRENTKPFSARFRSFPDKKLETQSVLICAICGSMPFWRFCVLAFWRLPRKAVQDNSGNFKVNTFFERVSTGYLNPKSKSV